MAAKAEDMRAVLGYFLEHPKSADSIEGITRWRLLSQTTETRLHAVAAAVGELVTRRLLVEQSAPGVQPMFRLNHARIAEAQRFLETLPTDGWHGRSTGNGGKS